MQRAAPRMRCHCHWHGWPALACAMSRWAIILTVARAIGSAPSASAGTSVWPPPQTIALGGEPGATLAPDFAALAPAAGAGLRGGGAPRSSPRLERAVERFNRRVSPARTASARAAAALRVLAAGRGAGAAIVLRRLDIEVLDLSESLGIGTDYSYTLNTSRVGRSLTATVAAASIFGAMYGLETFSQLVDIERGVLRASSSATKDS